MKFLVFLGIITTVAAFHQECSLQSCTQHQPYVVDDPCPIGNYTVSCLPFTINCQEPKLGSLVVRCSFYEDFLEYHDVRVVLDFI